MRLAITPAAPDPESTLLVTDALSMWTDFETVQRQLAAHTLKRMGYTVRAADRVWGTRHVAGLSFQDYQAFIDAYGARCSRFQDISALRRVPGCRAGLDGPSCPMLGGDPSSCPSYKPNKARSVDNVVTLLTGFERFLVARGYVQGNRMDRVRAAFTLTNRRRISIERDTESGPAITLEHILALLDGCPLGNATEYFLMAKHGLRPHELPKLNLTPAGLNRDEGWMYIPRGGQSGDKRMGNRYLCIDFETEAMLERWLSYRDALLGGREGHDLLVSSKGTCFSHKSYTKGLTRRFRQDCERLGLYPREGGHYDLTSFRRFFTSTLEKTECPEDWIRVFRGDRVPGAVEKYWRRGGEMSRIFQKYGPKLTGG